MSVSKQQMMENYWYEAANVFVLLLLLFLQFCGVWTPVCGRAQGKPVISVCFHLNTDGHKEKHRDVKRRRKSLLERSTENVFVGHFFFG